MLLDLRDGSISCRHLERLVVQCQHFDRQQSECFQFLSVDVVAIILCKAIDKEGTVISPEQHDGAVSARLALPLAGKTLLDNASAEISVDQAGVGPLKGSPERCIRDAFPCGKTHKGLGLEDAHRIADL
jgi:hypothetical protein